MEHKNTEVLQETKMSTIGVVAIVFSFVAAGAFGIEEAISSSGPGITLALLVIFPFVWCFPVGEMVAELGSLLPTEGRPLSQGADLEAMWRERAPLYARFRDVEIDNSGTVEDTAAAIWRDFCEHSGD